MIENKDTEADFKYEYSAPTDSERKEIISIRNEYVSSGGNASAVERLRAMHRRVKTVPRAISIVIGVIGTLVFGGGMAMFLEWDYIVSGAIVGVIGFLIAILAYPTFVVLNKIMKNKYAGKIIELSNEALGDNEKSDL